MDYATKYPEALLLKRVDDDKTVADSLVQLFSQVGITDELRIDQESNFRSKLILNIPIPSAYQRNI